MPDANVDPGGPPDPCRVGWSAADLEGWGGGAPSLAVDGEGRVHVAYLGDDRAGTVRMAVRRDSGSWEEEDTGVVGSSPSIAFDADGVEHVVVAADGEIRHLVAPDWDVDVVGPTMSGAGNPIALGSDGEPRVAWHDDQDEDVQLAVLRDGVWIVETVEDGPDPRGEESDDLALAVRDETAHVVYVRSACDHGCAPEIRYASNEGGAWMPETIAEGRERPSLAIAPDGTVHVVSYITDGAVLVYSTRDADGWIEETIDTGGAAPSCMAIGADGTVLVAHWSQGELRSATRVGSGWAIRTVARSGFIHDCAIAFDGEGLQHVAFAPQHDPGKEGRMRHAFRECR